MHMCLVPSPPRLVSIGSTRFGGTAKSTRETPDKAERAEGQLEVSTHSLATEVTGDFSTISSVFVWKDKVLTHEKRTIRDFSSQISLAHTSGNRYANSSAALQHCMRVFRCWLTEGWTYTQTADLHTRTLKGTNSKVQNGKIAAVKWKIWRVLKRPNSWRGFSYFVWMILAVSYSLSGTDEFVNIH